jgi:predicted metalloendopeptidase
VILIENFSVVQKNENGIAEILKSETQEYYTINYTLELMKAYGNFTFNNKQGNISFTLFDDGTTVLDNIPYVINKGLSLITRSYYENTVLPLIK